MVKSIKPMKWKKYLFFSFVLFVTFFYKIVNAEVISAGGYQDTQFMHCSGGACNISYDWSNSAFANTGEGEIVFNFGISANGSTNSVVPAINTMRVKTNQGQFACEYSSYSAPMTKFPTGEGNTNQSISVSARCPVNFGPGGLTGVIIGLRSISPNFEFRYYIGDIMTFTSNNQQVIADNTAKTKHAIDDTNKTIKDDSVDNSKASDTIDSAKSKLAKNGSITQLLTLPIQMYQNILNSVSGSCSSFSLGSLYNHDLTLSCIDLKTLLGSTLYNIIDILCCGLFILSFRKKMVDIFNHMSSLNDRGNEVE